MIRKKKSFFSKIFSGDVDDDEIHQSLVNAAKFYAFAGHNTVAFDTYQLAIKYSRTSHSICSCYDSMVKLTMDVTIKEKLIKLCHKLNYDIGDIYNMLRYQEVLAKLYESNNDLLIAYNAYREYMEMIDRSEYKTGRIACMNKLLTLAINLEEYESAHRHASNLIDYYSVENRFLLTGMILYYFECKLIACDDVLAAKMITDEFANHKCNCEDDPAYKLFKVLTETIVDEDIKAFETAIAKYDAIRKLDDVHIRLLLKIKKLYFESLT
jgi:hypothetical protein